MASPHPITTVTNPPPPPPYGGGRRHLILLRRRRRKIPVVRLGGGRSSTRAPRRGFSLARMLRRVRLRWLKLQFFKRLKEYYKGLVKDIIDAGATMEAYQQRMLMETSLAVPMGVSFSGFRAAAGRSDLYRLPPRYGGGLYV